jgi:hypothetical protein
MVYTLGARELARENGAYWLLDAICIAQVSEAVSREPFQAWTLTVSDGKGELVCTDGDKGEGPVILYSQPIPYTDFPAGTARLFVADGVVMLPDEY